MTEQLTHIDENGEVRMVDVSQKSDTERVAVAEGFISMKPETLALIVEGKAAKGDVLACARVAGVMAAKKTSDLIPMCHPLNITKAKVECEPVREGERADGRVGIHVVECFLAHNQLAILDLLFHFLDILLCQFIVHDLSPSFLADEFIIVILGNAVK